MKNYLIITGGSKGIGAKTVEHFIEQGWQAINLSRSPCQLPNVKNIKVDLSSLDDIAKQETALREILKDAASICLVHNAGYYRRDNIAEHSLEILQRTLSINVIAPVALNKIIIPLMKPGSSIIYIGSTVSEKGVPNGASYVVSKHAVVGLMRSTYIDLADKAIRSVCVCPGLVDTDMVKENFEEKGLQHLLATKVIAKRLIEPAEIASVIHFAAVSPVLNGIVIHANLGQVAD